MSSPFLPVGNDSESKSMCSVLRTREPSRQGVRWHGWCLALLSDANRSGKGFAMVGLTKSLLAVWNCLLLFPSWCLPCCQFQTRGSGYESIPFPVSGIFPSQNWCFLLFINPNCWYPKEKNMYISPSAESRQISLCPFWKVTSRKGYWIPLLVSLCPDKQGPCNY